MIKNRVLIIVVLFAALALLFGRSDAILANPEAASAPAFPDQRSSVQAAVFWMVNEFQNDDGGYASLSTGANQAPSTIPGTLDAILAITAAGHNPAAQYPGQEATPLDYLEDNDAALQTFASANGGQAGKVVLALTASAVDPRDFEDHNFVEILTNSLEPSGAYGVGDPFKQAMAMLGVASVNQTVPESAILWLESKQGASGAWDDGFGTTNNPDATAMAIMALVAAGREPGTSSIQSAVQFLADAQQENGWGYSAEFSPNANSTAFVIQALSALDEPWYDDGGEWAMNGRSPLQALLAFQSSSGAFQSDFGQGPFDDFFATVQAIPAASGRAFPLPARLEAALTALTCLDGMQDTTSGGWPSFAGGPVDASGTSRAIQAIAAAGDDPQSTRWTTPGGTDAVEALEALTPDYLSSGAGGRVGIVMQGVVAAGSPYDVSNFAGMNLPEVMAGHLQPSGEYDSTAFGIFAHAEAMLGLLRADEEVAPTAIELLLSSQANGDWGDSDANGIALQVLGELDSRTPVSTLSVLHSEQLADGGWGFGDASNPSATSEVAQGLAAIGQNPYGPQWSLVIDGRLTNAADVVMSQQGQNGCWPNAYGPGDDPYSTTDAILMLATQPEWGFSLVHLPAIMTKN